MSLNPHNQSYPSPGYAAVVVDTPFRKTARGIYVGGTGDVEAISPEGDTVVFSAVPVGVVLPIQATEISSTNTTATLMVALF